MTGLGDVGKVRRMAGGEYAGGATTVGAGWERWWVGASAQHPDSPRTVSARRLQALVRRQNARRLLTDARAERLADLPVMTEGVDDAAHKPAVLFVPRPHFRCSSSHRFSVNGLRVPYDQDEASRCTA